MKSGRAHNLFHRSTIFKFKVNSGTNQELRGVYTDFKSNQSKWTIDVILQHTGFYSPTENPDVMMTENHNTQSCEYIIIYHDELYIASTPPEEVPHTSQDKSKINIYLQHNICMILVEEIFVKSRNILESYMKM